MLAAKSLAHVAPKMDLRECTLHSPLQKSNKAEPTLALKPRGDITRNPKQGYQGPKKGHVLAENFQKKVRCAKMKHRIMPYVWFNYGETHIIYNFVCMSMHQLLI